MAQEDSSEIKFVDSDSFGGSKDGISFREIVMTQYNKCIREGSKEMNEGGVVKRFIDGNVVEVMAPNQREIFINTVEQLRNLLAPHIEGRWENCSERFIPVNNKIKSMNKEYMDKKRSLQKAYSEYGYRYKGSKLQEHNYKLKDLNTQYELRKVELYKELLVAISHLLNFVNYFEEL